MASKNKYRVAITIDGNKEYYEDEPVSKKSLFEDQWWRAYAEYADDVGNKLIFRVPNKDKILIVDNESRIILLEVEKFEPETYLDESKIRGNDNV